MKVVTSAKRVQGKLSDSTCNLLSHQNSSVESWMQIVTMVKTTPDDDNNNTFQTASYPIMVELKDSITSGSQVVEQVAGDEKVGLLFRSLCRFQMERRKY